MATPHPALIFLSVALLMACPPGGQDPGATTEPGSSSSLSGSTTSETTPTSTDATAATIGSSTTGDPVSTGSTTGDPATSTGATDGVETTGPADTTVGETTVDATTGGDTSGTTADDGTSTGDTGDIPDTTGGELCEPGADEVDIEWALEVPPGLVGVDIDASCIVVGAVEMEPAVAVSLNCDLPGDAKQVVLHYTLLPFRDLPWTVDEVVQLDYRVEAAPFTREWLRVIADFTRLWGAHADTLAPPGTTVEAFYQREVSIAAPCDPQPDPCGQRQGLELGFLHAVEGMDVLLPVRGGEFIIFGFPLPTLVWLEHASRLLEPIGCDDAGPRRFDMLVVDDASGF